MKKKIIITEEQFCELMTDMANKNISYPIMEENLKYCYIGSFFAFELEQFPDVRRNIRKNDDTEEIYEAAIGNFNQGKQFDVFVYSNDGGNIPHVHILDHETRGKNFDSCVRLDCVGYFAHGKHNKKFNSLEKKAFAKFMKSPHPKLKKYNSHYELSVDMWNLNNSNVEVEANYDENNNIIIPDYNNL